MFINHGINSGRDEWEIEHSKPKSKGGTDHLNNLYAACVKCNREKSNGTNYSIRSIKGVKKAPLTEDKKDKKVFSNTVKGVITGAAVDRFFGPIGIIAGGVIGAVYGSNMNPDK